MLNQLGLHQDRSDHAAQRLDTLTRRLEQTIKQQEVLLNSIAGLAPLASSHSPYRGGGGGGGEGGGGAGGGSGAGSVGDGEKMVDSEGEQEDPYGGDDLQSAKSPSRQGSHGSPRSLSEEGFPYAGDVSGGLLCSGDTRGFPTGSARSSTRKRASFKLREIPEEDKTRVDKAKATWSVKTPSPGVGKRTIAHRRASEPPASLVTSSGDLTTRFSSDEAQTPGLPDVKPQSPFDISPKSVFDVSPKSLFDLTPSRSPFDVKVEFKEPCEVTDGNAGSAVCGTDGNGKDQNQRL